MSEFGQRILGGYAHRVPIDLYKAFPGLRAGIFDMDDLMINSHPIHMEIFYNVVERHGGNSSRRLTAEEEASLFGLKVSDAWKVFIRKFGIAAEPGTLQSEFDALMLPIFERSEIRPMPGLMPLVQTLREHRLPLALASSARREKIDIVLAKLGLQAEFAAIVSGEDEVERGKPAPDIFLAAAAKLGVPPNVCAVFEDAKNGVEAANAADMFAVGVHNVFSAQRLGIRQDLSAANIEVDGLDGLTLEGVVPHKDSIELP